MAIEYKSFVYRIYPNDFQKNYINVQFALNVNAYNYFLKLSLQNYEKYNKALSYYEMCDLIQVFSSVDDRNNQIELSALKYTIKTVEKNIKLYTTGIKNKPKFKSDNASYVAYKLRNNNNIEISDKIKFSKIEGLKYRGSLKISGKIINVTISKDSANKYFATFLCKYPIVKKYEKTSKSIGIDVGYMNLATLSDGTIYKNNKEYEKLIERISYEKQKLSRMLKGSNRYNKQRVKIGKLYNLERNRRNDYLQKITTDIVKKFDVIAIEDLDTSNMINNSKYPEKIYDASWREFRRMLEYKCDWYDKKLIKVDKFYPSSQICSKCGFINKDLKDITIKQWVCPKCGSKHDRDVNAAVNLLKYR